MLYFRLSISKLDGTLVNCTVSGRVFCLYNVIFTVKLSLSTFISGFSITSPFAPINTICPFEVTDSVVSPANTERISTDLTASTAVLSPVRVMVDGSAVMLSIFISEGGTTLSAVALRVPCETLKVRDTVFSTFIFTDRSLS